MLEKNSKIIRTIILIVVLFFALSNSQVAIASEGDSLIEEMQSDINSFKAAAQEESTDLDLEGVTSNFKALAQILTMIGAGVMVGVTTYMGIKYLTAGPEAQAKLKTQLIGVVVAGVVIFGAYFIWQIVINLVSTF